MNDHGLTVMLARAHREMDRRPDEYPPRRPHQPWDEWVEQNTRTTPARPPAPVKRTPRSYRYLTSRPRAQAIERAAAGETYSAIGRSLGVSPATIRRAVLGVTQAKGTQ